LCLRRVVNSAQPRGIIAIVIRRLYVNNFRCLVNFELRVAGQPSVLLIGKNGSGKTTVGLALEILQRIARGTNRVDSLVKPKDLYLGRTDAPVRFEIEVELQGKIYEYVIAFELAESSKELRVLEEKLSVSGNLSIPESMRKCSSQNWFGSKRKSSGFVSPGTWWRYR
jgi:recombinational DNA repair ATPase RecF